MIGCEQVQAALSARLDGEEPGVADDIVDAHLSGCVHCQAFFEHAAHLNRQLKLSAAPTSHPDTHAPDLSELILAGVEPVRWRRAASHALGLALSRVVLVVVGLVMLAWAYRLIELSAQPTWFDNGDTTTAQLLIDAAAIRLALAFGLFLAAWRPHIAAVLTPIYGAFAAFSCGFATRDIILGGASAEDIAGLLVLIAAAAALLWAWLAGFGLAKFSQLWHTLTARPY